MIKHILVASVALTGAAGAKAKADEYGMATYYRNPWHGGLIAAHRTLPFGAHVRVTNLDNGRNTVVTIVDRGPFARGRIIRLGELAGCWVGACAKQASCMCGWRSCE